MLVTAKYGLVSLNSTRNGCHRQLLPTNHCCPPLHPPSSLQTRVGGGILTLHPLPRFKCKSEGVFSVFIHHSTTHSPPSLQMRVGGIVFSLQPPPTSHDCHQPPLSLEMWAKESFFVTHTLPATNLQCCLNVGRGVFFCHPHSLRGLPSSPSISQSTGGGFFFALCLRLRLV